MLFYCLDKKNILSYNKDMKKALSYFCLIFAIVISFGIFSFASPLTTHALSENQDAKVIVSTCYLYKADTFASEKVTYQDGENTVLIILKHGDIVNIKSFSGDFAYVTTSSEKEGYIYKYYITENSSQAVYPVFNASVRKNSKIFDLDKQETEYTIKKGSRIYIYKGFNDKEKYTAVQVVLEDESLYNGYILTANVKPDGVSGLLIVAISILIAAITITLSLVFIKKKKKKEKKTKLIKKSLQN